MEETLISSVNSYQINGHKLRNPHKLSIHHKLSIPVAE